MEHVLKITKAERCYADYHVLHDGRWVVCTNAFSVCIYQLPSFRRCWMRANVRAVVFVACVSCDGAWVALHDSRDSVTQIIETRTDRIVCTVTCDFGAAGAGFPFFLPYRFSSWHFSLDKRWFVCLRNRMAVICRTSDGGIDKTFTDISSILVSPDSRLAATVGNTPFATATIYRLATDTQTIVAHASGINRCEFSPDSRLLLLLHTDCSQLAVVDAATGDLKRNIADLWPVSTCSFSPDGRSIVACSGNELSRFDPASGARIERERAFVESVHDIYPPIIGGGGRWIVIMTNETDGLDSDPIMVYDIEGLSDRLFVLAALQGVPSELFDSVRLLAYKT